MREYRVVVSHEADEEVAGLLDSGLRRFNDERSPYHRAARQEPFAWQPLNVFLKDADGQVVGGATGRTTAAWGWLHVETLWIADEARGLGYGRILMETLEAQARERGCRHADLRTFSFQAPGLYTKFGYRVVGELEGYPPGESFLWMRKDLEGPEIGQVGRVRNLRGQRLTMTQGGNDARSDECAGGRAGHRRVRGD